MFSRRDSRMSRGRIVSSAPATGGGAEPDPRVGLSVPDCVLYLENGVSMGNSGGVLTSWDGVLGPSGIPGVAAPAYEATGFNGYPSFSFTKASSHEMTIDALAAAVGPGTEDVPFTLIAAVQLTATPAAADTLFSFGNSASAAPFMRLRANNTTTYMAFRRDDASASAAPFSSGGVDTNRHVMTWVFAGTTVTVRLDGVALAGLSAAAMNVGALTLNRFAVGAARGSGASASFCSMRLAELCLVMRALSGAELTDIEADMGRLLV